MARKQHSTEAGYIAERMNPFIPGTKVVIYEAKEQRFDVGGHRYAVVCDAHTTICGAPSLHSARGLMKFPEFCEGCMAIHNKDKT